MRKIILLLTFIVISFCAISQEREVDADVVIVRDSIIMTGGKITDMARGVLPNDGVSVQQLSDSVQAYGFSQPLDTVSWDTTYVPSSDELKGTSYWDDINRTVSIELGNGVVLQLGQESLIQVYNNTGAAIEDGKVCYGSGINGNSITIAKASNDERYSALLATTEEIDDLSYGMALELAGKLNNVNTGGLALGPIYLDVNGDLTNTQPLFPLYTYPLGAVIKIGVTDGIIQFISAGVNFRDTESNIFNGSPRESLDLLVTSDGATITASLTNKDGGDITLVFSDGYYDLDTDPSPQTVTLAAGTDDNPQINYVHVLASTKALVTSTSYWPSEEHVPIAIVAVQSAATTQTRGVTRNQNINNHMADNVDLMGRLDHMSKRIRTLPAKFQKGSGGDLTLVGSGTTNVYPQTTGANVWQLHLQSFDAIDVSTDYIYAWNDFTSPGLWVNDLTSITTDATGGTLNNKSFSVVIGGIQNSSSDPDHLWVSMPGGTYNNSGDAIDDNSEYTNYSVPDHLDGNGFLMYRLTFSASVSSTVWTLDDTEDLRGLFPNTVAGGGGGGGGGGITTLLGATDYPNSYSGEGNKIVKVGSSETATEFSVATVSDAGTVNIPSGQAYQINGSALSTGDLVDDGTYVDKTSTETIGGIKTFTNDVTIGNGTSTNKELLFNGGVYDYRGQYGSDEFFRFQMGTGAWTDVWYANPSTFNFGLRNGTDINEFSIDGTLSGNSDNSVPTEQAVKTYVDANAGTTDHGALSNLSYATSGHTDFVSINTAQTISGVKTFSADVTVPDEVYGAGWNGSFEAPTKNAVYDKIETIGGGGDMTKAVYDPANISEQLVGLIATQNLTNKTVNGVSLTAAGVSTKYLDEQGNYTTPPTGSAPAYGTDTQIPYMNSAGTGFIYSGNFTFDDAFSTFSIGSTIDLFGSTGIITGEQYNIEDGNTKINKDVSNNMVFQDAVTGPKTLAQLAAGGGGTPGGSDGDIQYNNSGAFGGFGDWDGTRMTVTGVSYFDKYMNDVLSTQTTSGNIDLNTDNGQDSETITLNGNSTLRINNLDFGQSGTILIRQDATGSRTLAVETYAGVATSPLTELFSGGLQNINPTASSYSVVRYERLNANVLIDIIWYE